MVTATKSNGDIRVYIAPQVLNKALRREFHSIPVVDDILPELSKAKVFPVLILKMTTGSVYLRVSQVC